MNRIFIVVNVDWFFLSHRLPIAIAAKEKGFDVTILAKDTGKRIDIEKNGLKFIDIPFERSGSNPLHELKCIRILQEIYKREQPDIIHHVTLKAALLGSIAAKKSNIKHVINAISGLGYNFTDNRDGLKQKLLKSIMKYAFKNHNYHYILQNPDDVKLIKKLNYTKYENIHLIKGSGVDLNIFTFEAEVPKTKVELVLPARMLYDKGVIEFIAAAKMIKTRVSNKARFILVGDCDTINLAGISENKLRSLTDADYIKWVGFQKDIFYILKNADVIVLPSYREGLPKSLIEACAVGRAIITTDAPGCRECVINDYNGYLVPVKNIDLLADKMLKLIEDSQTRKRMGENSRKIAEKEFSIETVIAKHIDIYNKLLHL